MGECKCTYCFSQESHPVTKMPTLKGDRQAPLHPSGCSRGHRKTDRMECFDSCWRSEPTYGRENCDIGVSLFAAPINILKKLIINGRLHEGVTKAGKTFELHVGKGSFDELMSKFDEFLNASFGKSLRPSVFNTSTADHATSLSTE